MSIFDRIFKYNDVNDYYYFYKLGKDDGYTDALNDEVGDILGSALAHPAVRSESCNAFLEYARGYVKGSVMAIPSRDFEYSKIKAFFNHPAISQYDGSLVGGTIDNKCKF